MGRVRLDDPGAVVGEQIHLEDVEPEVVGHVVREDVEEELADGARQGFLPGLRRPEVDPGDGDRVARADAVDRVLDGDVVKGRDAARAVLQRRLERDDDPREVGRRKELVLIQVPDPRPWREGLEKKGNARRRATRRGRRPSVGPRSGSRGRRRRWAGRPGRRRASAPSRAGPSRRRAPARSS